MASTATLRQIVYDALRKVRENHPEANVTPAQVAYWVIVHGDRLRKMHIGQIPTGRFMVTYDDIAALVDPNTGRNYFVLPTSIYDFENDAGIDYITYNAAIDLDDPTFTSVQVTRTTPAESRRLYMSADERPSPSNPYFYTSVDRVYLLGCEQINLTTIEAGLYTTLQAYDTALDLDQVFDFPQELIPMLTAEVVAMGLFITKIPREYDVEVKENAINVVSNKDIQK